MRVDRAGVVIFGSSLNGQCAAFDFSRYRKDIEVLAFVEDEVSDNSPVNDIPIISSDEAVTKYANTSVKMLAPLVRGSDRVRVWETFSKVGFEFEKLISPLASVWDVDAVGDNAYIQDFNNIQFGTVVGVCSLFWAGNHIGHHSSYGAGITLTSHVVVSGRCDVSGPSYFGVNCCVRDGVEIVGGAFIGQGANVTKNIAQEGVYLGNPARRAGDSKDLV